MAQVQTLNGTQLLVQVGDGADPEVFAHDCLINTDRGIQFSADQNRQVVPDCEDPDTPAWSELSLDGLSAVINGAGMLHTPSVAGWFAWFTSGASKNVRVRVNAAAAAGGGYWAGRFKLTDFEVTGARNEKSTVSVTLGSDGPVAWVAAT
ncbi:MAG: phage tail tube protein [Hyphomicrobiaceae bacterium]